MASITLQKNIIHTNGNLPEKGATAPEFTLVSSDLKEISLSSFGSKKKILNIFPSLDTDVCATSVKTFHSKATTLSDVVIINISCDLPFAQGRFCQAEGIKNTHTLSAFRSSFARDYGLQMVDGPLQGLCSRAIIVLDESNRVLYTEQVSEITQQPNYEQALRVLQK